MRNTPADFAAHLVQIDSVVLQESDSFFVAKPAGFAVGVDGRYLVSDAASSKVAEFARSGEFVRTFGRRGRGPGEFLSPTTLGMDGDSLLVVMDFGSLRVSEWSLSSGLLAREEQLPGRLWSVFVSRGRVYAGYYDAPNSGSVAVLGTSTDSLRMIGPVHPMFSRIPQASSLFGQSDLFVSGDTVATAFEISNHVYLHRLDGTTLDSLEVPPIRRAGAQLELLSRVVATDPGTAYAAIYKSSVPLELSRLSSGPFALFTADPAVVNGRATGIPYLSLLDFARKQTCPDAAVPVPADPLPRAVIRGDTLYVLAQHVTSDNQALTVAHSYRIDASHCQWRRSK